MTRPHTPAIALAALVVMLLTLSPTPAPAAPYPTPIVSHIKALDIPGALAFAMRGCLGNTNTWLGLSLLCPRSPAKPLEVTAYFGGFPSDARPVQLAVRNPAGAVSHFGPAVRGTPASGFHSPRITDPLQAIRFLNAALQPGSLVSNGYRSFRNQVSFSRNDTVRNAFVRCIQERSP